MNGEDDVREGEREVTTKEGFGSDPIGSPRVGSGWGRRKPERS